MKSNPSRFLAIAARVATIPISSLGIHTVSAQSIFTDDFDAGPSALWSNLRGAWTASGGVYDATQPGNVPPTFTGLPFVLRNFAIDVDIHRVADGGLWLRSGADGTNGVLLVTGGNGWGSGIRGGDAGRSIYWHVITAANYNNPPKLAEVSGVFDPGVSDAHLRVEVEGDRYSAYLNGSTTPVSTFLDANHTFDAGIVGIYDFSAQTFDNFALQIPPGFGPYSLFIKAPDASHVAVTWPTNAVNWQLESSRILKPGPWQSVVDAPEIIGKDFSLMLESFDTPTFFRLRAP